MEVSESLAVRRFSIKRIGRSQDERVLDTVAVEEPLEVRVRYWFKDVQLTHTLAVTMRTPGHDRELAAGLLLSEGILHSRQELYDLRPLGGEPSNELLAELSKNVDFETWRMARTSYVSSSCGLCGKRSIEAVKQKTQAQTDHEFGVSVSLINRLPQLLSEAQAGFAQTGGLHAAALVSENGQLEALFEDIGRHNALDKLLGWCFLKERLPLSRVVLFMSSRSSFELVQKASMAGAPVLASVGSPSSLAIESAREQGITLIGFVRDQRFNVYSGDWRLHSK